MTAERFAASQRRTGLGRFEATRGERRNAIKKGGCIYGALLAQYVRAARRELRYLSKRNLVLASRVQHLERWVLRGQIPPLSSRLSALCQHGSQVDSAA